MVLHVLGPGKKPPCSWQSFLCAFQSQLSWAAQLCSGHLPCNPPWLIHSEVPPLKFSASQSSGQAGTNLYFLVCCILSSCFLVFTPHVFDEAWTPLWISSWTAALLLCADLGKQAPCTLALVSPKICSKCFFLSGWKTVANSRELWLSTKYKL